MKTSTLSNHHNTIEKTNLEFGCVSSLKDSQIAVQKYPDEFMRGIYVSR